MTTIKVIYKDENGTENIAGGYNGKILRINLSTRSITSEVINDQFCRLYLGGAGFIAYYLWKELSPKIDALSPENKLIFALGPVSGLSLPGASRNCIGAKSPLTGGIAKSECGGDFIVEMKRAGYDAIILEGKSEKPIYLWINDGEVSIRDAGKLWGKDTKETQTAIREELADEYIQVASIGLGGENMVLYACIMEGLHDTAGRGGLGAVMGSKNLKAIAIRGHKMPNVADEESVKKMRQKMVKFKHPMSAFGTGGPEMEMLESIGNLPVRNFHEGLFPQVKKINGVAIKNTMRIGMEGCYACPYRCKKVVMLEEPYRVDPVYGGPEYETLGALGSNCGIANLNAIVKGNERCNAYSLDTISTGVSISFAMECYEKGLLTKEDTGGLDLRFGNAEAMLEAIELIAKREGFGNFLAEGTARMAQQIGKGAKDFAIQVKGLEAAMHEPRLKSGMAFSYMFNAAGADHCNGMRDELFENEATLKQFHYLGIHEPISLKDTSPRKVGVFRKSLFDCILGDCMVLCMFTPYSLEMKVDFIKAVCGWDTGIVEQLRIGERIVTLMRMFNAREGFTKDDDILPERFFHPKTNGVLADTCLNREELEKARRTYYILMGWDENGVPLPEKVEELDIE